MEPPPIEARAQFTRLLGRADAEIPLAEAALWISAESRPGVEVPHYLAEIDAIAERAAGHMAGAETLPDAVGLLNESLFSFEGFRGNETDYNDPVNSFLDAVLDRRTGIPITLCVVFVEVARRVGLDAAGIGFPGHFLAKVRDPGGDIVVDAFYGRVIERNECEARLRQLFGDSARLDPRMLTPAPHREILRRMLGNLKQIYFGSQSWEEALRCSERLLLLAPEDPEELRDRGLVLRQLECYRAAAEDLERFVALAPSHPTRRSVDAMLVELRQRVRQIH